MALVFYDKKKKTLNFYRNSQRPLHFLGQARAMYWASESRDLINAVGIIEKETPLPFSETDTGIIDGKVYSLPEETLVSIDISKCNYTWSMKKIAPPVPKYVHRYGQSFDSEWNDNSQPWNNEHRNYNSSNMTFLELARKKLSIMGLTSLTKAVSRGPFHVRFGKNFEPITDTSIISVSPRTEYTSYAGWESETKILPSYYRTGETRYAVELNSFMSNWMYEQLCTFRKANPEVFLKKLQSTFLKQDKTSRLCSARLLGISLNTLQQLVRGKSKVFNSYVFEPYTHNNVGNLCILKNVSLLGEEKLKNYVSTNDRRELALTAPFTKSEIAAATSEVDDSVEFSFEEVAVKDGTVPPFKKPTPLLLSQSQGGFREGEGFPAGLSGKLVSKEHYLDRIRVGCVCCCSGVPLHEDIFWLDDVAFLCEACQETLTKPEHLNSAVSLNCAQDLQNIEDQIAARNLLKRQENRNVLLN
jgi:hypothetical protein